MDLKERKSPLEIVFFNFCQAESSSKATIVSWAVIFERVRVKANIVQRCFIQKITYNHPTMWVSLLFNGYTPKMCVQQSITLGISLTTCGTFTKAKAPVVKQGLYDGGR